MSADANSIEPKDLIFIGASCCCFGALYKGIEYLNFLNITVSKF